MRVQLSVFCQCHSSSTSYHDKTDLFQYQINLVTRVPVDLHQKTNLNLNNRLDPQILLGFSACTRYAKWCLLYVVSCFYAGNIFVHGNQKEGNKYKIGEMNRTIIVLIAIYTTYLLK